MEWIDIKNGILPKCKYSKDSFIHERIEALINTTTRFVGVYEQFKVSYYPRSEQFEYLGIKYWRKSDNFTTTFRDECYGDVESQITHYAIITPPINKEKECSE
jgi:hypothetical protein